MLSVKRRPNRQTNHSLSATLPAPVGGLNTVSSYDTMPSNEAIVMDNYIPASSCVRLRKGYKKHATLPFEVKTIIPYKNQTGGDKLFAVAGNMIYEISQKGDYSTVSAVYLNNLSRLNEKISFTSAKWQWTAFKDRLFLTNGIDTPLTYLPDTTDTTFGTFEPASFNAEGLNINLLSNVFVSKQRLWFVEKNSMRVWYTKNAGEVAGELIPFDMSAVASFGGTLVAGASWTQDGGAGMDDLTVFITSEGEVLVYKGNDPSNASDWTLKGVYKMAAPIGEDCFLKYFGDLVVISKEGYVPLSKALPLEGANASLIAFSANVSNLIADRGTVFGTKAGWQGILYPKGGFALFNVPLSKGSEQYVCNTTTGAWCRFTGINALYWALFQNRLYFAKNEAVYLFDEGYVDDTEPIHGRIEQAFTNLSSNRIKRLTLLNPRVKASRPFALKIYTNTDFSSARKSYQAIIGDIGESYWNTLKWSTLKPTTSALGTSNARWATLAGITPTSWISNMATGTFFSLVLDTTTIGTEVGFYSTGLKYELGF